MAVETGEKNNNGISSHRQLWDAVADIRVDVAEVKGRVSIILMGVGAIFVAILGLLVSQVFAG